MADLATFYQGRQLPDWATAIRNTARRWRGGNRGPQPLREASRDWWAQRIPELPDPPGLPSATRKHLSRNSTRRWQWLRSPDSGRAVHQRPLPRYHPRDDVRRSVRPHPGALVEHPAIPVERAAIWPRGRASRRRQPGRRLHLVAAARHRPDGQHHSSVAGAGCARSHAERGSPLRAIPACRCCATSPAIAAPRSWHRWCSLARLGLGELFRADVTQTFGTPGWIISQGPQVSLDAQVTEFDGGVLVNWDVREDVFPAGVIDAMFAHHIDELLRLAAADDWDVPDPPALPAAQRAVRDAANSRSRCPQRRGVARRLLPPCSAAA